MEFICPITSPARGCELTPSLWGVSCGPLLQAPTSRQPRAGGEDPACRLEPVGLAERAFLAECVLGLSGRFPS